MRIFHVSEESDIAVFEPRAVPSPDTGVTGNAVWAVDEAHLANYLLPRDCPRVTYGRGEKTTKEDAAKFVPANAKRVVIVESAWLERIDNCTLYLYELPSEKFDCVDEGAGYFISRTSITPLAKTKLTNLREALAARGAEVRVEDSLWPAIDAVAASSLEFSIIRKRNAQPR